MQDNSFDNHSSSPASFHSGLILDIGNKITSNATVESWRYCFNQRRNNVSLNAMYTITLAAYRIEKLNENEYSYSVREKSILTVQHESSDVEGSGRRCFVCKLEIEEQFEVSEGDVLGACHLTPFPLHLAVIVNSSSSSARSLVIGGCSNMSCSACSGGNSNTSELESIMLLLHVGIREVGIRDPSNSKAVVAGVTSTLLILMVSVVLTSVAIALFIWQRKRHFHRSQLLKMNLMLSKRSNDNIGM